MTTKFVERRKYNYRTSFGATGQAKLIQVHTDCRNRTMVALFDADKNKDVTVYASQVTPIPTKKREVAPVKAMVLAANAKKAAPVTAAQEKKLNDTPGKVVFGYFR